MTQEAPAAVGQRIEEVDTPALILDLEAFEKNLETMRQCVAGRVRVRADCGLRAAWSRGDDRGPTGA